MPCGWRPRAQSANPWTRTAVVPNPWSEQGAHARAWSPDPFFLLLDDGGFLELPDCGRLALESAHV